MESMDVSVPESRSIELYCCRFLRRWYLQHIAFTPSSTQTNRNSLTIPMYINLRTPDTVVQKELLSLFMDILVSWKIILHIHQKKLLKLVHIIDYTAITFSLQLTQNRKSGWNQKSNQHHSGCSLCAYSAEAFTHLNRNQEFSNSGSRKTFVPSRSFLINLFQKTTSCIRLKLRVWKERLHILRIFRKQNNLWVVVRLTTLL